MQSFGRSEKPADSGPLGARSHASEHFPAYDLCLWKMRGWVDWMPIYVLHTVKPSQAAWIDLEHGSGLIPQAEACSAFNDPLGPF